MIISINGKIINEKKASIPVTSDAFLFSFAVFETLRTYHQNIFHLRDHLLRLMESIKAVGIPKKWSMKKIEEELMKVMKKRKTKKEARIRIILTRNDLIIMVEDLDEKADAFYEKGVKLSSFEAVRNIPEAKTLGNCFSYVAKNQAMDAGAYDSVLVDQKGYIRECAYANIFWVKDGKLYTTKSDVLIGITREIVMSLADKVILKDVKLDVLESADEVFVTQSTTGIVPAVEINGKKIGSGKPGSITKELLKKYMDSAWAS